MFPLRAVSINMPLLPELLPRPRDCEICGLPTPSAPASATIPPTPANARRTLIARTRLIHGQGSAFQIFAVEEGDGLGGVGLGGHFDEPEAARAASVPILHDVH